MLTTRELSENPTALAEALPFYLKPLPGSVAVAKQAARYVMSQYSIPGNERTWMELLRNGFIELGKHWEARTISWASLRLPTSRWPSIQAIQPPDPQYIPLGPVSQRCWTRPELVAEFQDLLHWRTQILEKHGHAFGIDATCLSDG